MMLRSGKALLLHVSSALLIPTKYIRQLSRVTAEALLVNTEKSGRREGWRGIGHGEMLPRFGKVDSRNYRLLYLVICGQIESACL